MNNKTLIAELIQQALTTLQSTKQLPNDLPQRDIPIENCRNPDHGDFASNIALTLAKIAKQPPRQLAEQIVKLIPKNNHITDITIAGPGFINFKLTQDDTIAIVNTILKQQDQFGHQTLTKPQSVHIEFVSANPTGPLHVGHGRGAAYGACVANLLRAAGYSVHSEYYVNDVGRQMRILALSTWLRYLEHHGQTITLPKKAYQGDYIIDIAKTLSPTTEINIPNANTTLRNNIPTDITDNKEQGDQYIDACIEQMIKLIGQTEFDHIRCHTLDAILADIKEDLGEFGVTYTEWFRESRLMQEQRFEAGIELLKQHGYTYEKAGALWFRATELGDEKDRVLIRANGQGTYFASDVAYHLYKYNQGFDRIIDIFGSDHHGYIARIRAFLKGLGQDPDKLTISLVQFAILYRGKEKIPMSTRSGQFVTLRELRQEVGNDAARFFYIMRKPEQHLDFDLTLAASRSNENPVYYIQYAHARICSVWRQLGQQQLTWDQDAGLTALAQLNSEHEQNIFKSLARFPELVQTAAERLEPHLIAHYLQTLANLFHTYYNASKFIVEDNDQRNAKLCLIAAVGQTLRNGLSLLGISAPEAM